MSDGAKVCTKCGEEKPLAEYHRDAKGRAGLSARCKVCARVAGDAWYAATGRQRYAENREGILERQRAKSRANPHYERTRRRVWRSENPEADRRIANRYREKHPEVACASNSKRRATKLNATPAWADHDAIRRIYEAGAMTGYHVDHQVPLRSPFVCGLHCEANLQLLPPSENISKGNRHWPDMPTEVYQ